MGDARTLFVGLRGRTSGSPEPVRPGRLELGRIPLLGWLLLGALALWCAAWLFPRAFPAAPLGEGWQVERADAVGLVLERVRDLGRLPAGHYVTASLRADPLLEMRLLEEPAGRIAELRRGGLGRRVAVWRITVFRDGAGVGDWSYLGEVGLDGTLLTLLQGVEPEFESPVLLSREDAVARADRFLRDAGFDLDAFREPSERRVEMTDFSYQLLRYRAVDPTLADVDEGVEVRFAGDELKGFLTWEEDPRSTALAADLRGTTRLQFVHILGIFVLLPVMAVIFVRRYHEGLVGVKRGVQVLLIVLGASFVALVFSARGASEGMDFGGISRSNVTVGWIGIMLFIYFPTLAMLAGMSCAVGESLAHGTWRSRLATLDAVLRGRWANADVAASSLRGAAAGLVLLSGLLAAILFLQRQGFAVPFGLVLGPWWPSAALPGVMLFLVQLSFTVTICCFSLLALLPLLATRVGVAPAASVTALAMSVLFFAPFPSVPALAGFPVSLAFALATVLLFLRYDFMVALHANLLASVGLAALALVEAGEPLLQVQGAGAMLACVVPLFVSLRHLGGERRHRYQYDDVPPHVRRIAERERQRVELETARGIQSSILPVLPERLAGVEVSHTYLPATEVGGDFYDAMVLADGRLCVAIGDVAGHGVSSGLIMSMARSALAVQVTFQPEVADVMRTLNRVVYQSARRRLLTTLCYALLDPATRTLRFASAGHLFPYRVSMAGEIEVLESVAYPLGVRESLDIQCREASLEPGDAIFLASDGLVEARRRDGEELFGFERLEESLARHAGRDAAGLRAGVLEDLERFVSAGRPWDLDGVVRDDDMTLLVLRLP